MYVVYVFHKLSRVLRIYENSTWVMLSDEKEINTLPKAKATENRPFAPQKKFIFLTGIGLGLSLLVSGRVSAKGRGAKVGYLQGGLRICQFVGGSKAIHNDQPAEVTAPHMVV